jgi:hypothetical protein
MPTNHYGASMEQDDDYCYTYPIAYEGEEIQWDLMVKHGRISQDTADCLKAAENLSVTQVETLLSSKQAAVVYHSA